MYTVYILYSEKLNRYYTGCTENLNQRINFHFNAEARKFTSNANDWALFWKLEGLSKNQAFKIETHIKKMKSKKYIVNLKKYSEISQKLITKYKDC